MDKIKLTFSLFLLASVMDLIGVILKIPLLIYIFKPLIIIALLFLYVFSLTKRLKWYVIALEFSFFGDVLLMFSGKLFFMAGLISFLMAHILFIKIVINRIQKISILKGVIASIPFFLIFVGLIYFLKNSLNELWIPVIIYGITISTFGAVSLLDFLQSKTLKSVWMLAGAIIFILSDSLLAIHKFYSPNSVFEVLIMVTYIVAQYLIFKSMVISSKHRI